MLGGFRHFVCLDQIGLKPGCAQNHSFWALWLFRPNWAEARICPKTLVFGILHGYSMGGALVGGLVGGAWLGGWMGGAWVAGWGQGGWVGGWRLGGWVGGWRPGGWVAPGCWLSFGILPLRTKLGESPNVPKHTRFGHSGCSDQMRLRPECAQICFFSVFWLFGPNWAEARMCPKNVPKNIRFRHSGQTDKIGLKPECAQKHWYWAFWLFEPNGAEARMCPKHPFSAFWLFDGWRLGGWVGGWRPGGWVVPEWRLGGWVAPGWVGGWVAPGWMRGRVAPGWMGGARVQGGWVAPGC